MITPTYTHREAFCLMKYQADDGSETEVIWNSRDGVTPFTLTLRSGMTARHIDWDDDVRVSQAMADALGVRRFVNITEAAAWANAVAFVERWWDHEQYPMNGMYPSKDEAVEHFAKEFLGDGTAPSLVEAGA